MNEFEDLLNSVSQVETGDVVSAEVLTVDATQANVAISGTGVEGVLTLRELTNDRDADINDFVKVGEVLDVLVLRQVVGKDTDTVTYLVSKKRLEARKAWDKLVGREEEVVTVKGTRAVKGGLSVEFEGVRGFIPASMLDTRFVRNAERFVGQEFDTKIKEVNAKENRFILSRREVVEAHKGNYTYRRVHLELRNRGYLVNHKRVQGLMKVLNLQAKMRQKRKYSSHKGDVGKKAENLIQGQFEGSKTMEKCYTDVTEFAIPASTQKLYLSPVLDGFNSEIIAYNLSTSPNLEQVQTMLEQAFKEKHYENTILHSDQGWQYQHDSYHRFLESKGIQASMSRKGNSPDNGMMESFFGILKSEMFYGYEKSFQSLKQLEQAIVDYIDYYNNKRIKVKLKGLSPVQYRTKSFG
ncbi:integrase core domain-containing protein [Streptococcus pneumoniae]|uniref:IS3 family transposase n=1 Tax=Streptococcus pneumoniae TaxID=1313 RepID=UPI0005E891DC|nr:IS3 family transposase [Streptococcus pneumoniae]CJJ52909.1 integrase core domain-containing protein [Streptococcus pneumoniae]